MADMRYGNMQSSRSREQGIDYFNNSPVNNLSSHINLVEDFSPFRRTDPFWWIPQGVYEDLLDARNEQRATGGSVDDNTSNYNNQQMFNIFNSNVLTLQAYRNSLINNVTNPTSGSVVNLFGQYGY